MGCSSDTVLAALGAMLEGEQATSFSADDESRRAKRPRNIV